MKRLDAVVAKWTLRADMVVLGRRRFNARHLTSVIQSAAELHFDDESFMDKISQNLLGRMDRLDAIEVTDLVGFLSVRSSKNVMQSRVERGKSCRCLWAYCFQKP